MDDYFPDFQKSEGVPILERDAYHKPLYTKKQESRLRRTTRYTIYIFLCVCIGWKLKELVNLFRGAHVQASAPAEFNWTDVSVTCTELRILITNFWHGFRSLLQAT